MRKQLLLSHLASQIWALEPTYLTRMASVLQRWSTGEKASPEVMADIRTAQDNRAARVKSNSAVGGGIAVLSLSGVMSQKANMINEASGGGGTSTDAFTQQLNAAIADPAVAGIIISIDSPGGSVFGTGELASALFAARGSKPVFGYVDSLAASAAYWVGSQCSQLFITPGGQCGSVGVYTSHLDESGAMEKAGYAQEFISAGTYKLEGNSLAPLGDEARAFVQSQIDGYYAMFIGAVAKGRGVPAASVRSGFGQGRCLMAGPALAAGMVDGICSFAEVVRKMQSASVLKGTRASAQYSAPRRELAMASLSKSDQKAVDPATRDRYTALRLELELARRS